MPHDLRKEKKKAKGPIPAVVQLPRDEAAAGAAAGRHRCRDSSQVRVASASSPDRGAIKAHLSCFEVNIWAIGGGDRAPVPAAEADTPTKGTAFTASTRCGGGVPRRATLLDGRSLPSDRCCPAVFLLAFFSAARCSRSVCCGLENVIDQGARSLARCNRRQRPKSLGCAAAVVLQLICGRFMGIWRARHRVRTRIPTRDAACEGCCLRAFICALLGGSETRRDTDVRSFNASHGCVPVAFPVHAAVPGSI